MKCCNIGCENEGGVHWACDSCCSIDMCEPEPNVVPCKYCGSRMYEGSSYFCSELCEKLDNKKRSPFIGFSEINDIMNRILWNSHLPDDLPF